MFPCNLFYSVGYRDPGYLSELNNQISQRHHEMEVKYFIPLLRYLSLFKIFYFDRFIVNETPKSVANITRPGRRFGGVLVMVLQWKSRRNWIWTFCFTTRIHLNVANTVKLKNCITHSFSYTRVKKIKRNFAAYPLRW